jgi:hypothetical protein
MAGDCDLFLENRPALGRQAMNVVANEFLHVGLAFDEERPANAREFVRPALRHIQSELPDVLFADQFDRNLAHGILPYAAK